MADGGSPVARLKRAVALRRGQSGSCARESGEVDLFFLSLRLLGHVRVNDEMIEMAINASSSSVELKLNNQFNSPLKVANCSNTRTDAPENDAKRAATCHKTKIC